MKSLFSLWVVWCGMERAAEEEGNLGNLGAEEGNLGNLGAEEGNWGVEEGNLGGGPSFHSAMHPRLWDLVARGKGGFPAEEFRCWREKLLDKCAGTELIPSPVSRNCDELGTSSSLPSS